LSPALPLKKEDGDLDYLCANESLKIISKEIFLLNGQREEKELFSRLF